MLLVAGAAAVVGYLVTLLLPEPARRNLEEVADTRPQPRAAPAGASSGWSPLGRTTHRRAVAASRALR